MKNASAIIGLLLSFYFSLPLASHSQSLTRDFVLSELYGRQLEFDGEGMLVMKDPAGIEFRTALEKTLYYETNGMKKALVVLFSYEYDADMGKIRKGMEDACHACYPEFDLAYFSLRAGKWQKDRFIRSWEGASGTWGEGAQIEKKTLNARICLTVSTQEFARGEFTNTTVYYDIESLKNIKTTVKQE